MSKQEIKDWLLGHSEQIRLDNIRAFDQVYQARKYCACMNLDATDLQIWNVLIELRREELLLSA